MYRLAIFAATLACSLYALLSSCAFAHGPIMKSFLPRYESAKLNFIETAALFPEAAYSYRLTPAQRTVGEWIEHTISSLHNSCGMMEGKRGAPMDHLSWFSVK